MATYPLIIVRFRLVNVDTKALKFAKITAEIYPKVSNSSFLNTVVPQTIETRTNQYGIASLTLTANDHLEFPGTKYLITVSHNGNSYYFLIELTQDTPEIVDFEELLDRNSLAALQRCKTNTEGNYKISGSKLYL